MNVPKKLLVIAQSARMLTQMAIDAGFVPVAIDCFGDSDTRQLALDMLKVKSLALADIQSAVEAVRKTHGLTHLVYGSGFETCADTLTFLEKDWIVLGNPAAVFRRFQDKREFFRQLSALSIRHPETVFTPPEDAGQWLIKPVRGEGGGAIAIYNQDAELKLGECYWQRFLEGEAQSVLFVASNGKARALGFNRQWTTVIGDDDYHRFVFAGVASHSDVSVANQQLLSEWLVKLVRVYPLRGLGSLDFIVSNGRCYVLEVNARIPASAQLYGESVFALHIQACLGIWDDANVEQALPAAYGIIYAKDTVRIPEFFSWPKWVVDRPYGGAIIGKGQPICSIIVKGNKPSEVSEHLRRRQQIIENILNTGS